MDFNEFEQEREFREAWDLVRIVRPVNFSLFTFGETELPYYLVSEGERSDGLVAISKGEVRIKRPTIITPQNASPEFRNFFESPEERGMADFLLARTAYFGNLQFDNQRGEERIVSDSSQEVIEKLNRQLDAEEEERVTILTAPSYLAGFAVMKYAMDRVLESGPHNIQELRERGFLP